MIYEVSATDIIIFDEIYRTNIRPGAAEDVLNFTENVLSSIKPLFISDTLLFHEILAPNTVLHFEISDTLTFSEATYPRTYIESISDILFFTDYFDHPPGGNIHDVILFNESFPLVQTSKATDDLITFVETLSLLKTVKHPVIDQIVLDDHTTCIRLGPGDNPGEILFQTLTTFITLTDDQARVLQLPYPKFGDTENYHFKRINRQTRDLSPIITKIPAWNRTQLFKMEFDVFDPKIIADLEVFLKNNLGKPVQIVDHNSVVRNVIIQNPDREISTIGRDYFNFTLDCYELI